MNPPRNVNGVGRGKRRWNPAQVGCSGDMYPDYVAEAEISVDLANFSDAQNLKRSAIPIKGRESPKADPPAKPQKKRKPRSAIGLFKLLAF